jgi:regulator of sigma E protease
LGVRPGLVLPLPAVAGDVVPGGPADQAGIQSGDRILALDGMQVASFEELAAMVRERPGETVELRIERGGEVAAAPDSSGGDFELSVDRLQDRPQPQELVLTARVGEVEQAGERVGQLGVQSVSTVPAEWLTPEIRALRDSLRAEQRYGVFESVTQSLDKTWEMSALTVRMLGRMVVGDVSMRNISGPIAIAGYAGDSAQAGLDAFLSFLAIVSISLGILNLLPVPILDGGQIVYQLAEWIKGTPLSERAMAFGQQLGILLMILLMGFVFYNDLSRVIS